MEKLRILFSGDFCIRNEGVENLYDEKIDEISTIIKEKTNSHDVSVVNVETVFTDAPTPTKKSGPNIASPTKAIDYLKKMGFTIGALANNHVCDQGDENGAISKNMIEKLGISTMGYGKNLREAQRAVRVSAKGKNISFLNFAENEFTPAGENEAGFAPIDSYANASLIKSEKEVSDFVFVMLHAGNEFCPFPRSGIKKLARHFVDAGADAVIISHPHTAQGYEYYDGKPIIYSTGNFFMSKSSKEKNLWNYGYMASLTVNPDGTIDFTPIPYEFGSHCEYFEFLSGEKYEKFIAYLDELCDIIKSTGESDYKRLEYAWSILYMQDAWNAYLKEMSKDMSNDGAYMLACKNLFCCESHHEVMQNLFTIVTANRLSEFEAEKKKILNWQNKTF
jgi:poly-gamma-glutamate synthesis protein (capsule biosynthesis protein)